MAVLSLSQLSIVKLAGWHTGWLSYLQTSSWPRKEEMSQPVIHLVGLGEWWFGKMIISQSVSHLVGLGEWWFGPSDGWRNGLTVMGSKCEVRQTHSLFLLSAVTLCGGTLPVTSCTCLKTWPGWKSVMSRWVCVCVCVRVCVCVCVCVEGARVWEGVWVSDIGVCGVNCSQWLN